MLSSYLSVARIFKVATIAANGDEQIGKMITEAFEKAWAFFQGEKWWMNLGNL